jgi:leucyl-tRNA synthetase
MNYKLRDWIFSRQRYWGEPIPIIHCKKCGIVPLSEKDLPLLLPKVKKYQPTGTGESPLAAIKKWLNIKCPKCGGLAKRETNTMPQWAGSCWYFLRFADPKNKKTFLDAKKGKYWLPVDLYVGGAEHAVLHLLYSRFWIKVLYDAKVINFKEPFLKLRNQGLVLAPGGQKMSKSRGNAVNPDEIIKKYGADTLRLYEMFMGPFEDAIPWDTKGIEGCSRFLKRVWNFVNANLKNKIKNDSKENQRLLNKLIKKITEDIGNFKFNTAVSAFMEFLNKSEEQTANISRDFIAKFLILLSPFAPHICEELWSRLQSNRGSLRQSRESSAWSGSIKSGSKLGRKNTISKESWPKYNPKLVKEEIVTLVIQINGKVRDKVEVNSDIIEEEARKLTLDRERVKTWIEGKEVKKVIFVPGKLINIVV